MTDSVGVPLVGTRTVKNDQAGSHKGLPLRNVSPVQVFFITVVESSEEVHEKLDEKMTAAFHSMYEMAQAYKVNNRVAAYLVAVSRVAEAVRMRGWV